VGEEHVVEANSLFEMSRSTATVAGPALAGLLLQVVAAPVALVVDALSYVASAAFLAHAPGPLETPLPSTERAGLRQEIVEGLQAVAAAPVLAATMAAGAIVNLSGSLINAAFVLYATRELGLSPVTLGAVFAATGLGALTGSVTARPIASRFGIGPGIVLGAAAVVLARLCAPAAGLVPLLSVPLLIAGQLVTGAAFTVLNVTSVSLRQMSTPPGLRGRVAACARVLMAGGRPIGALLGGALGVWLGLQTTLLAGAALTLLGLVPLLLSPIPRLRESLEPQRPAEVPSV
jgi:predicted MFS family arabinose efflux permease